MISALLLSSRYLRRALSQALNANGREALRALLNSLLCLFQLLLLARPKHKCCPLCGWRGTDFFPKLETNWRLNRGHTCPRCSSDKRYRTYAAGLRKWLPASNQLIRVLEIAGTESSKRLFAHLPRCTYVSADLQYRTAMVKTDIRWLAFGDRSFDFILCSHVLEHVKEDQQAMEELHRILREGGTALLQVPMDQSLADTIEYSSPNPRDNDHVRRYGGDYGDRLSTAGFDVFPTSVWGADDDLFRYGGIEEKLYFCSRSVPAKNQRE